MDDTNRRFLRLAAPHIQPEDTFAALELPPEQARDLVVLRAIARALELESHHASKPTIPRGKLN